MATTANPGRRDGEAQQPSYLADRSISSWLFTTDHKRIGILYMISITCFFAVGGVAALLIRLSLLTPNNLFLRAEAYNKLFSLHGIVMVWFFLIPSIPAVLGNFVLPLMLGARDVAFPRINLTTWYLFMAGGLCVLIAALQGGVDTGWTFYAPYSTLFSNTHVILTLIGIVVAGFGSILTGMNFIITVHKLRCPGMRWSRLPLFVWSLYSTSIILVLATPVLAMALILVGVDRVWRLGIFDPSLGGDPLLFEHLFWFYSHPAVYIMNLPGMGVVSEIIPTFARRPIFGYKFVAGASLAIALFGFLVWGHHMFVAGQSMFAGYVFSFLSFVVAVPSAIKVFNWTATLYKSSATYSAPMLYALGFVWMFTIGGLTGLFLATLALDVFLHDTLFVVAHFHFIMVGGMVTAYLGGLHYWWPKISGRMYPENLGKFSAFTIFSGFNLTFFPQFWLGYLGNPRRYYVYPPEFQILHVLSTAGTAILFVGYALPLVYLLASLYFGKKAPPNPWGASGLEWQTPSPPPAHNFEVTPVVDREPYAYFPETAAEIARSGSEDE